MKEFESKDVTEGKSMPSSYREFLKRSIGVGHRGPRSKGEPQRIITNPKNLKNLRTVSLFV